LQAEAVRMAGQVRGLVVRGLVVRGLVVRGLVVRGLVVRGLVATARHWPSLVSTASGCP